MPRLRAVAGALSVLALVAVPAIPASAAKQEVPLIRLHGGTTTIAPGAGFAAALRSLGVTATVLAPGTSTAAGYAFPIVSGRLGGNKPAAGYLRHFGGLRLSGPSAHVDLNNLRINDGPTASLTTQVGSGARVSLATLDMADATIRLTRRRFVLAGAGLVLTDPAAKALDSTFRTTAFAGGTRIGRVTVKAKVRIAHVARSPSADG